MSESLRTRARAYDRLSGSLGFENGNDQAREPVSKPNTFVLGYARTITDSWTNDRTGEQKEQSTVVPLTVDEVKEVEGSKRFAGFFLPISSSDFGRGGSCRELNVPAGDFLATATPRQRLTICPTWDRLFSLETLQDLGGKNARFIQPQEIE